MSNIVDEEFSFSTVSQSSFVEVDGVRYSQDALGRYVDGAGQEAPEAVKKMLVDMPPMDFENSNQDLQFQQNANGQFVDKDGNPAPEHVQKIMTLLEKRGAAGQDLGMMDISKMVIDMAQANQAKGDPAKPTEAKNADYGQNSVIQQGDSGSGLAVGGFLVLLLLLGAGAYAYYFFLGPIG